MTDSTFKEENNRLKTELDETKRLIAQMTRSFEEKLADASRIQERSEVVLKDMGVGVSELMYLLLRCVVGCTLMLTFFCTQSQAHAQH